MTKKIGILIHFNGHKDSVTGHQMIVLLDLLIQSMNVNERITSIKAEIDYANSWGSKNKISDVSTFFSNMKDILLPDTCRISVLCSCVQKIVLSGYALIMHSNCKVIPIIKKEQTIYLEVFSELWNSVQERVINSIVSMCNNTNNISYVVIDEVPITPKSIYYSNLRLFSNEKETASIDPEVKIPGIYWIQYFSDSMISKDMVEIIKKSSTDYVLTGDNYHSAGIWVRTSSDLSCDRKSYHRKLYDLFKVESYRVDPEKLKRYKRLQPWLFSKFPL